ncbi:MAG TPA: aspartate aminotransferase family protein [Bacillota bacterium]|nr:aspartate aminotransferase family protein [Bacillota bacterium]
MNASADLLTRMKRHLAPSLARDWPNLPVAQARGSELVTIDGQRYLDFTSGMAVTNVGHNHPEVVTAARRQVEQLIHGAVGVVVFESLVNLAEQLPGIMPGGKDMFFFAVSGSDAVEGSLKLARHVTGRPGILAFTGGFHGRTLGAVAITTSKPKYRAKYEPLMSGVYLAPFAYCYRCPYYQDPARCSLECVEGVKRLLRQVVLPSEIAAMVVEPILGEGGYVVPPRGFLAGLREICDEHGILLIFDEIQTGFGRTGDWFASQTFGVTPDILAVAKSIASGFPLSAVCASRELMERWPPGSHGTTFGGNAVAAAAAVATLAVLQRERLPQRAREMGGRALQRLKALAGRSESIGDVRGEGLMIGLEFVEPGPDRRPNGAYAWKVRKRCLEQGLLLYGCGLEEHVIRFIPPLMVSESDLDQGLDILERAVLAP